VVFTVELLMTQMLFTFGATLNADATVTTAPAMPLIALVSTVPSGITTEIVGGSASARENSSAARPVVCRKRTTMVRWKGRVTCQVTPALARRLAQGPVRLRTTVTLKLKGRADVMTVGRRITVLRNAAGARVTG
jgi:hypothetical protein